MNKQEVYAIIQDKAAHLKVLQEEITTLEEQVNRLKPIVERLNKQQVAAFEQAKQNLTQYKEEAMVIDHEIKVLMNDLRNVGKEEIQVLKQAYPGTYIQIGKKSSILSKMTNGTFLLEFGELNV